MVPIQSAGRGGGKRVTFWARIVFCILTEPLPLFEIPPPDPSPPGVLFTRVLWRIVSVPSLFTAPPRDSSTPLEAKVLEKIVAVPLLLSPPPPSSPKLPKNVLRDTRKVPP